MNHVRPFLGLLLIAHAQAQWTLQLPTANPGARSGHGMAADGFGNVLLFGGSATGLAALNDTWRWDGLGWTQLTPATSPGGRSGIEVVYDAARGRYVIYGGWTAPIWQSASQQTWEFDGTTWVQATPATDPGGRHSYGACYDLARGRLVLYGGTNGLAPVPETWEYDGSVWHHIVAASAPGPLQQQAMCYCAAIGRTVMFGGLDVQFAGNDSTWLYDGATWVVAPVTGARPAPRSRARMIYDSSRGVCLMFGGWHAATGAVLSDTWEFDGSAWTQVASPATGASGVGLAYDDQRRQVVRYGGTTLSAANAETWVFGAQATTFGGGCAGSNGVPTLAAVGVPRLAASWTLTMNGAATSASFAIVVLGNAAIAPVPLAAIGMPGCSAWIVPDLFLGIPAAGGVATWTGMLPSQAGFVGMHLYAQGLSFDPGINPAWLTASNAVDGLLGR